MIALPVRAHASASTSLAAEGKAVLGAARRPAEPTSADVATVGAQASEDRFADLVEAARAQAEPRGEAARQERPAEEEVPVRQSGKALPPARARPTNIKKKYIYKINIRSHDQVERQEPTSTSTLIIYNHVCIWGQPTS